MFLIDQLSIVNNQAEVVVAQSVERSPPTPEIRGSNPAIGKHLSNICNCQLC